MARQDTENLFRRYKNQVTTIKTISGGLYKGRIVEVTNDYVAIPIAKQTNQHSSCLTRSSRCLSMMFLPNPDF